MMFYKMILAQYWRSWYWISIFWLFIFEGFNVQLLFSFRWDYKQMSRFEVLCQITGSFNLSSFLLMNIMWINYFLFWIVVYDFWYFMDWIQVDLHINCYLFCNKHLCGEWMVIMDTNQLLIVVHMRYVILNKSYDFFLCKKKMKLHVLCSLALMVDWTPQPQLKKNGGYLILSLYFI